MCGTSLTALDDHVCPRVTRRGVFVYPGSGSILRWRRGQQQMEGRTLARTAVEVHVALHPLDDAPHQRQPQAQAAVVARLAGIALVEVAEDPRGHPWFDADPLVLDRQPDIGG